MLYSEGWQGCKKDSGALIYGVLLLSALFLTGCHETATNSAQDYSLDAFENMKVEEYALSSSQVREGLEHCCKSDHDGSYAARHVRKYYSQGGRLVWVDPLGVDCRADSLLSLLNQKLPEMGFHEQVFSVAQIDEDLRRLRTLDFDESHGANMVMARLEYNLSKAYLRYVAGQRYGFVNPDYVLNRFDAREVDSLGNAKAYRQLFDVDMEHADDSYVGKALSKVTSDGLCDYMRDVEPKDSFYHRLMKMLPTASASRRQTILVNMERRRWRELQQPEAGSKYVIVNVPAFHLWAVSPDTLVDMRAACGALKTKTPLLSSKITHMEVNPEWVIPMSIVRDDVARHAGDSSYFARHRYYIVDKNTGHQLSPRAVSQSMLLSGKYRVAQKGGAGNSLGRIIFRFPNNFSVFLHDTSSPGVFQRDNRGVSHGCVRVQRPFDLAVFMMGGQQDEWQFDKLRISMGMKPETDQGREYLDELDPSEEMPRLIRSMNISPRVPLFITYYTLFQTPDGALQSYPDVYGYDAAIGEALKTYTQ